MRFESFSLERWIERCMCDEKSNFKYMLSSAGVSAIKLSELVTILDTEMELSYGTSAGSDEIREEISELYCSANKGNVMLTITTSEANLLVAFALLNKNDEMVTIAPTYMQIRGLAKAFGTSIKELGLKEEESWRPNLNRLNELVSRNTKVIYVTNPNNPTGSLFSEKEMRQICEIADDAGAYVISDEIFRGLELGDNLTPAVVDLYERGVSTGGLTKIGLAGLRIGWIVADKKLIEDCKIIRDYTTLANSPITESLAIIALQKENYEKIIDRGRRIIRDNFKILSEWIERNSLFKWVPPQASTLSFPRHGLAMRSTELCNRVFEEEGILIVPGDCYGFPNHLRIGFGNEEKTFREALDRFQIFLNRLTQSIDRK